MATLDFSVFESEDTTEVTLTNPVNGDDIEGVKIVIYGQDSEIFKAESRKIQTKIADYMRRNKGKTLPPEEFERLDKAKVIKCTKSIEGLLYNKVVMTDAEEVYTKFPWILEQVIAAMVDRSNFIKA